MAMFIEIGQTNSKTESGELTRVLLCASPLVRANLSKEKSYDRKRLSKMSEPFSEICDYSCFTDSINVI